MSIARSITICRRAEQPVTANNRQFLVGVCIKVHLPGHDQSYSRS